MKSFAPKRQTRRLKARKTDPTMEADLTQQLLDANADFSLDELREFLEADFLPEDADPAFKERLRDELWAEFEARMAARRGQGS